MAAVNRGERVTVLTDSRLVHDHVNYAAYKLRNLRDHGPAQGGAGRFGRNVLAAADAEGGNA
jgi:hypothetical protein